MSTISRWWGCRVPSWKFLILNRTSPRLNRMKMSTLALQHGECRLAPMSEALILRPNDHKFHALLSQYCSFVSHWPFGRLWDNSSPANNWIDIHNNNNNNNTRWTTPSSNSITTTTTTTTKMTSSITTIAPNTTSKMIVVSLESIASMAIWLIKRTFQPSILRKRRKTGFLARSESVGGRKVLARRRAKGRARLAGC